VGITGSPQSFTLLDTLGSAPPPPVARTAGPTVGLTHLLAPVLAAGAAVAGWRHRVSLTLFAGKRSALPQPPDAGEDETESTLK
jgi:hypothetical protein